LKKVGIYIRVSTQEQAQEGYSIQAQKERLISYCKAKDWLIGDIYIDGGYSGSNLDRPAIQKLISDVDSGKLDLVLVYKLDRLSRSQKDTLHLIEDIFLKNNVDFVSMNESFDTSTPFGRAMIGILSVFAQLERETIKERSLMGRTERAKEGLFHGGGYIPIGYDYVDGKLIVNEYEAMQVRELFKLYLEGNGTDKIREILQSKGYKHKHGDWSFPSAVLNVLDNPLYIGKIVFKGATYDGIHQPIIEKEVFEAAQKDKNRRRGIFKKVFTSSHLLTGLIYCGNCSARYFAKHNVRDLVYYSCYSRAKNLKHMIKDPNCKNKNWNVKVLDKLVEEEVLKLAVDKKALRKLLKSKSNNNPSQNNSIIEKKISDLDKQIAKLMDLYQIDMIPVEEISSRIEKLHNEKKELEKQLVVEEDLAAPIGEKEILPLLENLEMIWKYAEMEEKRKILRGLINKIVINGEEIKIEWSFI